MKRAEAVLWADVYTMNRTRYFCGPNSKRTGKLAMRAKKRPQTFTGPAATTRGGKGAATKTSTKAKAEAKAKTKTKAKAVAPKKPDPVKKNSRGKGKATKAEAQPASKSKSKAQAQPKPEGKFSDLFSLDFLPSSF